jgi:hypothetical protein
MTIPAVAAEAAAEASRRDLERIAREASAEADRPSWMRKNPGGPSPGPGGPLRPIEGDGSRTSYSAEKM